jgi:hypothetical protein
MPDPESRARRFRERAAECLQHAETASTTDIREHYRMIAEHYTNLAVAEEAYAKRHRPDD